MNVEAEVSLYPLTEINLKHPVHDFAVCLDDTRLHGAGRSDEFDC